MSSIKNIALILGLVGLLFSFYYIYTVDNKLKELKKLLKDLQNDLYTEEENEEISDKNIPQKNDNQEIKKPNDEKKDNDDISIISKSECNEKNYYNSCEDEENVMLSNIKNFFISPVVYNSDKIQEIINEEVIEQENDEIEIEENEIEIEENEIEIEENEIEIEENEIEIEENEIEIEENEEMKENEFPPNTCRVKIKSGTRKGQICGKKTKGLPYCTRHGLYN